MSTLITNVGSYDWLLLPDSPLAGALNSVGDPDGRVFFAIATATTDFAAQRVAAANPKLNLHQLLLSLGLTCGVHSSAAATLRAAAPQWLPKHCLAIPHPTTQLSTTRPPTCSPSAFTNLTSPLDRLRTLTGLLPPEDSRSLLAFLERKPANSDRPLGPERFFQLYPSLLRRATSSERAIIFTSVGISCQSADTIVDFLVGDNAISTRSTEPSTLKDKYSVKIELDTEVMSKHKCYQAFTLNCPNLIRQMRVIFQWDWLHAVDMKPLSLADAVGNAGKWCKYGTYEGIA